MNTQKTCVVTGGAGFIGSHLCKYLLNKDYLVFCLDNLLTGNEKNISEKIHSILEEYDFSKSLMRKWISNNYNY